LRHIDDDNVASSRRSYAYQRDGLATGITDWIIASGEVRAISVRGYSEVTLYSELSCATLPP
jgi:hypothetical protein